MTLQARTVELPEFRARATPLLMANEAQNSVLLGYAAATAGPPKATYVLVEAGGEIVGAAAQSPPHPLIFTASPSPVLEAIVRCVAHLPLTVASGVADAVELLAGHWAHQTGAHVERLRPMRIFQLEAVREVPRAPGTFAVATDAGLDAATRFITGFLVEAGVASTDPRALAQTLIAAQRLFFWNDPHPVSCAGWAGPTPNGVRVNSVYTPPELRGRGYATSCVAALSAHLLGTGKKFCFLYTDLDNPTSNRIYARIGYRPVCDTAEWSLTKR